MKEWWLLVIAVQMIRPMIYLNWELGPIQKILSTYHTRRWDISLNFLIPTYCYELKEIWNHVHNADAMALFSSWLGFDIHERSRWLAPNDNKKYQIHDEARSSFEKLHNWHVIIWTTFFSIKSIAMCSNDPPMIKHKNRFHGKKDSVTTVGHTRILQFCNQYLWW